MNKLTLTFVGIVAFLVAPSSATHSSVGGKRNDVVRSQAKSKANFDGNDLKSFFNNAANDGS